MSEGNGIRQTEQRFRLAVRSVIRCGGSLVLAMTQRDVNAVSRSSQICCQRAVGLNRLLSKATSRKHSREEAYNQPCQLPHSLRLRLSATALDDPEVSLLRSDNQQTTENGFVRRSSTESVCKFCFLTVRAGKPDLLEVAEEVHCKFCPTNPRSPST